VIGVVFLRLSFNPEANLRLKLSPTRYATCFCPLVFFVHPATRAKCRLI
jgi:hypothetical protein